MNYDFMWKHYQTILSVVEVMKLKLTVATVDGLNSDSDNDFIIIIIILLPLTPIDKINTLYLK